MDAFAVSIGKGLTVSRIRVQDAVKSALWFGGFQMLFPILGYFAASTFREYVTQFDHWIIFALLVFIGGNMVHEAFEEDEENSKETAQFDWKHMLPLAVACSIDAFAVGVSLTFMFTKAHSIRHPQHRCSHRTVLCCGPVHWPRVRFPLAEAGADRRRRGADSTRRQSAVGAFGRYRVLIQYHKPLHQKRLFCLISPLQRPT